MEFRTSCYVTYRRWLNLLKELQDQETQKEAVIELGMTFKNNLNDERENDWVTDAK